MILTCPECGTRYNAKDDAFRPAGRRVRCAKCGHAWHQGPPEPEIGPEPGPEAEAEKAPEPASKSAPEAKAPPEPEETPQPDAAAVAARRTPNRLTAIGGWIGLVAVVLVIGWAAVSYRQNVATLWPRSATLYHALGLPVNVRGLAFEDVAYHDESEDNQTVLAISGRLVNVSGREQPVPPVQGVLSSADGRALFRWSFKVAKPVLGAGESMRFLTRLSSPPPDARHVELSFAGQGE